MAKNLPDCVVDFIEALPENRSNETVANNIKKFGGMYGEKYVESVIWSQEDARRILSEMGLQSNTSLFDFYLHSFELPEAIRSEDLYGLSEIYADFRVSYWEDRYPEISEKYLQISSIEGEYSYFYKKDSGEVFGVAFFQMEVFMTEGIEPLFSSFYEFLNWYYSANEQTP